MLAVGVIACGDSTTSHEPSPEVVATAEAVSRTVVIAAPISTTPVSGDEEEDPVVLDARVFGDGRDGRDPRAHAAG